MAVFEIKIGSTVITIPDDKLGRVRDGFLKIYPIPRDEDGDPTITQAEHFENIFVQFIRQTVLRAETRAAQKAITIDVSDITDKA